MRSNRFVSLVAAAAMAAAAFTSDVAHAVVSVVSHAWNRFTSWLEPSAADRIKSPAQTRPCVALVAARSFLVRLMRRERPIVTPLWRMCPSV